MEPKTKTCGLDPYSNGFLSDATHIVLCILEPLKEEPRVIEGTTCTYGCGSNYTGGVMQVLVHVSTYQGPFWYRILSHSDVFC